MGRCTSHLVDLKYATINIFILDLLICIMNHMIYCCVRFISGVCFLNDYKCQYTYLWNLEQKFQFYFFSH